MTSHPSGIDYVNAMVQQILDMLLQAIVANASQFPAELALGHALLAAVPLVSPTRPRTVGNPSVTDAHEPTALDGGLSLCAVPQMGLPGESYPGSPVAMHIEPEPRLRPTKKGEHTLSRNQQPPALYPSNAERYSPNRPREFTPTNGNGSEGSNHQSVSGPRDSIVPIQRRVRADDSIRLHPMTPPTEVAPGSDGKDDAPLPIARPPKMQTASNYRTESVEDPTANCSAGGDAPGLPIARRYEDGGGKSDGALSLGAQQDRMNSAEEMDFLDEARLGRWLLNYLATEASRPNAGITCADPRITPTYPGAPIGG